MSPLHQSPNSQTCDINPDDLLGSPGHGPYNSSSAMSPAAAGPGTISPAPWMTHHGFEGGGGGGYGPPHHGPPQPPPPPPPTAATAALSVRPSSTTSKESETEVTTSGYLSRQESQSRGSDETLSSPRSPEGSYGIIEFSMSYDENDEHLVINVVKAKKLRGTDANGLSDTYCKVSLVPQLPNKGSSTQSTKVVAKSINPHYGANMHFTGVTRDIFANTSVLAAILDEDLSGDHLLAETKFSLQKALTQMNKKFQLPLDRPNLKNTYDGLIVTSNVGRIEVSLVYYTKSSTLKVCIMRCIELQEMDDQGSANPFVKVVLHPSNKNSRHNTTTKWRTLDPEFREQFVYTPQSAADLSKQSLNITVWHALKGKPDLYMGGIVVGPSAKGGRLQHWMDMIKNPSQVQVKSHFLSANYID